MGCWLLIGDSTWCYCTAPLHLEHLSGRTLLRYVDFSYAGKYVLGQIGSDTSKRVRPTSFHIRGDRIAKYCSGISVRWSNTTTGIII
jgi:hypothetical protein